MSGDYPDYAAHMAQQASERREAVYRRPSLDERLEVLEACADALRRLVYGADDGSSRHARVVDAVHAVDRLNRLERGEE